MEQFFQQPAKKSESSGDDVAEWKSQASGDEGTKINSSSGFDCNICLELVQDPVVTMCGHLYCWPCIYEWMKSKSYQQLDCPVCKAGVSHKTLIPLYGRGQPRKQCDRKGQTKIDHVPQRPSGSGPSCGVRGHTATASGSSQRVQPHGYSHHPLMHSYYSSNDYSQTGSGFAGTTTYNLMIDMLDEMIYARNIGNPQTTLYIYLNTYSSVTMRSARLRRHVMQVDKSLNRVSHFLFCCAILCLLLF